jgi:hypothetical protein
MIFRLGIVSPLKGLIAPMTIFFISAVLFGIPHFAGMPNGIIGATLSRDFRLRFSEINVRD